jgi:hypothetical protein
MLGVLNSGERYDVPIVSANLFYVDQKHQQLLIGFLSVPSKPYCLWEPRKSGFMAQTGDILHAVSV